MWTPRRLLLFLLTFLGFFAAYWVYDLFLGHYDGLPPLPSEFRRGTARGPQLQPGSLPQDGSGLTAQLERAFGPNCEEKKRRLFEWRAQGILVATEEWKLLPSGRLLLTKVSVAIFNPGRPDQPGDEINTIKGDEAEIEFDQPVNDLRDAAKRKPVAGELRGNVVLKNNRRSPTQEDDVRLLTSWLKYRDDQQRVWTDAPVRIVDDSTGAVATAVGMEVELIAKSPEPTTSLPPRSKRPAASVSGVRTVRLAHDVRMEWPDDGRSNFLAGGERRPEPASPPPTPADTPAAALQPLPKSLIVIQSAGPFVFNVEEESAEFTDQVQVLREHQANPNAPAGPTRYDQLNCEALFLKFARKERVANGGGAATSRSDTEGGWDILLARARGKAVELAAEDDAGNKTLHAIGGELIYDKAQRTTRLTSLTGRPLVVDMHGHELRLTGLLTLLHPPEGGRHLQEAHAEGPGEIRIRTTRPGEAPTPPIVATWQRALHWTKDQGLDRLQFLNQAAFADPQRGRLEANDQIVVWVSNLESASQSDPATAPTSAPGEGPKVAPRRLEATGEVRLSSSDVIVRRTDKLVVAFKEPTGRYGSTPSHSPTNTPPWASPPPGAGSGAAPPGTGFVPGGSPLADAPAPPGQRRPPIIVTARLLDIEVERIEQRYEADRVRAEGDVVATQAAQVEGGKPLDLRADRLDLRRHGPDFLIDLFGQPASVQFERLTLTGPIIKLDQQQNTVEVAGRGMMKLPSRTDFQGNRLRDEVDVVVTWSQRMLFDGKLAEFSGQVVAEQQGARLTGNDMRVELAHRIPLRERPRTQGEAAPAISRLLAGGGITLEKRGDRPGEYQRVRGQELDFNNADQERRVLIVRGPGQSDLLQLTREAQVAPQAQASAREELKLTRVIFEGAMEADQQRGIIIFRESLQMYHLPSQNLDQPLNPDDLPRGAFFLTCEEIQATMGRPAPGSPPGAPGAAAPGPSREFRAFHRVRVHANEFTAVADELKYDEGKDLLILEGRGANRATLFRQTRPGAPRDPFSSRQIRYDRLRNQVQTSETDAIFINAPGTPPR